MATGTTTIDFGSFPGTTEATVVVTGQGSILSGSLAEAWVWPVATSNHTVGDHLVDAPIVRVDASTLVAGTGFTIFGTARDGNPVYGVWTVAWAWS